MHTSINIVLLQYCVNSSYTSKAVLLTRQQRGNMGSYINKNKHTSGTKLIFWIIICRKNRHMVTCNAQNGRGRGDKNLLPEI
jgi:hypothetical protein